MFSYFSPVNNNVNGINWVEFQFDQIIDVYNYFFFCKYTGNFSTHEIQKDIFKSY
jgi:hypothetical protein